MLFSQDDGVVSYAIPVRNSLKFNKYLINPTFSFVREQNPYISLYNKRQWTQFENAPLTYLVAYSGRFLESEAFAVSVFQQNYGILSTVGVVTNFAHNVQLQNESNLTFGANLAFYKSGLNDSKIITNYPDPSLENIPSNSLFTVNPGINYGTTFLDFGISINNLVLYNLKTSKIVKDDPEKSIQAHVMHTGYIDSYGFFDRSKFSGLLRTEFKKDKTIISGLASLNLPIGIWAQAGYNTFYGVSGGIGMNITQNISFEYNYETGISDISDFGASHEIVLAYKFNSKNNSFIEDDEQGSIISPAESRSTSYSPPKLTPEEKAKKEQLAADVKVRRAVIAEAKLVAEAKSKEVAINKPKPTTNTKPKIDAVAQTKLVADAKIKADALAQEKIASDAKAKADALAQAKLIVDTKAKADALAQEKIASDAKAKADALAQAKLIVDTKAKVDALAQEKLAADAKTKADSIAQAKLAADTKSKADALAQEKLAADAKSKTDSIAKAKVLPKDDIAKSMDNIAFSLEATKKTQQKLLTNLNATVSAKQKDLQDMKEENDLSEKGIFKEPKPFKSTMGENEALIALNLQIAEINKIQNIKIKELEGLYNQRVKKVSDKKDGLNLYYLKTIEELKSEQLQVLKSNNDIIASLEKIKIDTEIEKRRRIKKAAFVNEQDRFTLDKATLERIKETTPFSASPIKAEDFDYGEEQANMQIIKSVKNVDKGFYLVVAVHSDVVKRDAFLTKAVAAGQTNINFFYDVNSSKYFIYYDKFKNIEEAKNALQSKGSTSYNGKMSITKIEN